MPPVIWSIDTLNLASQTLSQGNDETVPTTIVPTTNDAVTETSSHDAEDAVPRMDAESEESTTTHLEPTIVVSGANNIPRTETNNSCHNTNAVGDATEMLSQLKRSILHRHSRILRAEHHRIFLSERLKKKVCPTGLRLDKRINVMDSADHDQLQTDITTYFEVASRGLLKILVSHYEKLVQ